MIHQLYFLKKTIALHIYLLRKHEFEVMKERCLLNIFGLKRNSSLYIKTIYLAKIGEEITQNTFGYQFPRFITKLLYIILMV